MKRDTQGFFEQIEQRIIELLMGSGKARGGLQIRYRFSVLTTALLRSLRTDVCENDY